MALTTVTVKEDLEIPGTQVFNEDGSVSYQEPTLPVVEAVVPENGPLTITKVGHGLLNTDYVKIDTITGPVVAEGLVIVDADTVTVTNDIAPADVLGIFKVKTYKETVTDGLDLWEIPENTLVSQGDKVGIVYDGAFHQIDGDVDEETGDKYLPFYFTGGGGGGSSGSLPPTNPNIPIVPNSGPISSAGPPTGEVSIVFNAQEIQLRQLNFMEMTRRAGDNQQAQLSLLRDALRGQAQASWQAPTGEWVGRVIMDGAGTAAEDLIVISPTRVYQEGEGLALVRCSITRILSTDPNREALVRTATSRGCTVHTVAQVREALAGIPNPTAAELRAVGNTPGLASATTRAGALASRWGAARAVGGLFLSAGIQAGFIALDWLNIQPLGAIFRQGRLQVRNVISSEDGHCRGVNNKIFYVPINIEDPAKAQITIRHTNHTQQGTDTFQFRICDLDGTVPYLDLTQSNPCPFINFTGQGLDRAFKVAQIGDHHRNVIPGRPFDIFICCPAVNPAGGIHPVGSFFEGVAELLTPPVPANESVLARAPNQLPRMFWLNWRSNTQRRTGGVGHYLTWHETAGLCLATPYGNETDPADTRCPDGGPGYVQPWGSAIGPSKYIFLGTAIPGPNGVIINMPGCRMLWNMYNRLNYDDWRVERQRFVEIDRTRQFGLIPHNMARDPLFADIWHHQYVNPTGQAGNPWYFSHPNNGRMKIGICGPLTVRVAHREMNRAWMSYRNAVNGGPQSGNENCSRVDVSMTALSRPADDLEAGMNEYCVLNQIDSSKPPMRKQYCFVGTSPAHYMYEPNYGALISSDDPDLPLLEACYEGELVEDIGTLDDKGFGMQGSC